MEMVKRRRRLGENEAALFSLQLLSSMRYLHANGIIHRASPCHAQHSTRRRVRARVRSALRPAPPRTSPTPPQAT